MKQTFLLFIIILIFYGNAAAQNDVPADIQAKLKNYVQNYPSEKLYVHTDKNFYTAGEIIWLKIYQLDTTLKKTGVWSKVAYVEILNSDHTTVIQTKIKMNEKDGNGSIELPLTLNSGYYTLRAYTNWMKNFGASSFFEKKIILVNPLKSLEQVDSFGTGGSVDLLPEGGNLVNGIPSQIAFKITGSNGKGTFAKGYLIDEKDDTLQSFIPYHRGMGSFNFAPVTSHNYKVSFVFDDHSFVTKQLPVVYKEGYVMHIEDDAEKIKIKVQSNIGNGEVFLIGLHGKQIKLAKRNILSSGIADFVIDKSELAEGVNELTIFNNHEQPVCERLFFIQPSQKTMISTTASKASFINREEVSLNVSSSQPTNLSVAVYKFDSLQTADFSDISTYVWLESELNRSIEDPQYYLSGNSNEIKKAVDLLMLTHGWRKFSWNTVLNEKPLIQYAPEISGQIITCRVQDANHNPAKGAQIFLSIPETGYKLYSGTSNDSGIVKINVWDFYGKSEMIVQAANQDENYKIQILDPYFNYFNEIGYPTFIISADQKTSLENYSIAMQSQHIYTADSIQKYSPPNITDTFPFFGKSPYTYKLDDYTRFTTMEEVLREYVRNINVGVKGANNLTFKLFNEDNKQFYTNNILVLLDGIPVVNPSKIFSLDPLKILRIDIIPKSYVLGSSLFHGVASFTSYTASHEGLDIDPSGITLDYEGLQIQREFYSPDYSTEQLRNSRIPDLRNTLFWTPGITNQKIQFFTGDNKGRYLISIQGLGNDSRPLSSVWEFEVK